MLARLIRLLVLLVAARAPMASAGAPETTGRLSVYFLNVGQGDAALIVGPTGKTVLVDGGPPETAGRLTRRLSEAVQGPIDLVVLSHAHADHLGGLTRVIQEVGARRFLDPEFNHPSPLYRELLELLGRKQIPLQPLVDPARPDDPLRIGIGGGAMLTVVWPQAPIRPFLSKTRSDVNANSLVARVSYGRTAFLFTGDSEADTEAALLEQRMALQATVLKVAHHGSRHSSGSALLARVRPGAAVISCGANNEYGHPHAQTLQRLKAAGARVFRTDQDGEVRAISDGERVVLSTAGADEPFTVEGTLEEEEAEPRARRPERPVEQTALQSQQNPGVQQEGAVAASFATSRRSKVFHRMDCPAVQTIKPENLRVFSDRAEAAKLRAPAEDCHP